MKCSRSCLNSFLGQLVRLTFRKWCLCWECANFKEVEDLDLTQSWAVIILVFTGKWKSNHGHIFSRLSSEPKPQQNLGMFPLADDRALPCWHVPISSWELFANKAWWIFERNKLSLNSLSLDSNWEFFCFYYVCKIDIQSAQKFSQCPMLIG